MRGWFIVLALVLVGIVYAADPLCSDTDNGGARSSDAALTVKGEVKYGITTQVDTCLTAEEGVSTSSGKWLKEYYCSSDQRQSHAYDCIKMGFEKCDAGACFKPASGTSTGTQQTVAVPEVACGNEILEKSKGEECDPPNKICFGKTSAQYGICGPDCKCQISAAAEKAPEVCGDGTKDPSEECEADTDCQSGFVCSSCKCVKQLTPEEIEAMKQQATAAKEAEKKEITAIEDKYKTPELSEVDLTAKNFTEEPGIKATSGIANFFKKIFGWLAALFS